MFNLGPSAILLGMRLNTRGQYALRATLIVACRQGNQRAVSLQSIAESESISQPYLEQLFQRLRKSGIVISLRGPGGGYMCITRP